MKWRPPRKVTFGSGNRRWVIPVHVVPLSAFHAEAVSHCGSQRKGPVPRAMWCPECIAIYLREDRRSLPAFTQDFLHELDHAYIDFRGAFYEP